MNTKRKLVVSVLGMMVALLIGILALAQIVQASPSSQPKMFFGSWSVDAATTTQSTQFPALMTFTADGSVLTDEPPVPGETTGHGNWVQRPHGEVGFTFVALYGDPTGVYAGKLKVVGKLHRDADKDTWSGPFKITVFGADNQVAFEDTGTFKLTRIEVELLD